MKCECELCIYNLHNYCNIDDVEINASGMCDSIIFVTVSPDQLDELKEKQLAKFDKDQ